MKTILTYCMSLIMALMVINTTELIHLEQLAANVSVTTAGADMESEESERGAEESEESSEEEERTHEENERVSKRLVALYAIIFGDHTSVSEGNAYTSHVFNKSVRFDLFVLNESFLI